MAGALRSGFRGRLFRGRRSVFGGGTEVGGTFLADVGEVAAFAVGLARRADVAAVENEPVVGLGYGLGGDVLHQRFLGGQRCARVVGEAQAV